MTSTIAGLYLQCWWKIVPSGKRPSRTNWRNFSGFVFGESSPMIHCRLYTRLKRHFSHLLPILGGEDMTMRIRACLQP